MREILFRGMTVNGKFVEGNLSILKNDLRYSIKIDKGCYISNSCGAPFAYQVRPDTVGQFTGLVDKHGRKIFEGDIVKITDHTIEETFESCGDLVTMLMTRTYEVFWNATKWSIKSLEPMLAVDPLIFDLPTNHVTYEIIGNIHDQKEDV